MDSESMIRGLTLTHPWAYCIAHGGKDVENRSWRPERQGGKEGMWLAIHGGTVPGRNTGKREEARMDLAAALMLGVPTMPQIGPSAVMTLSFGHYVQGEEQFFTPGIVAVARLAGVTRNNMSAWAVDGQYHWQLADVLTLPEPIPHRGAQGLWQVEGAALVKLREAWMAAKPVKA